MKKIFSYLLIFIGLFALVFAINTSADSGWDSDYDSGGWDSGSDYDYDYDYDSGYDYDYDSDYGSSGGGSDGAIFVFIFIFVFVIIVSLSMNGQSKGSSTKSSYYRSVSYNEIDDSIFGQYGLEKEQLKKDLFDKFIEIQNAWMNFDYDTLSKNCTNELFNTYKSQLNVLKVKNGKNIMHGFKLLDCKVTQIKRADNKTNITVFMKISFYDYVVNSKTCKVTRGNKYNPITNNYIMTFIKGDSNTDKCPSCGAKILGNTTDRCEYCRSVIVKDSSGYILSKKTNVNR